MFLGKLEPSLQIQTFHAPSADTRFINALYIHCSNFCLLVVNRLKGLKVTDFLQVLHIRNLPYETTHEELVELAAPFGRLVQSKLNVGPNRNQAFIEFPDQTAAVTMCNYFNGSADPAKASILP